MVAMAAADGKPDAKEISLIQQIYEKDSGRTVGAAEVEAMANDMVANPDFLASLRAAARHLDTPTKEEIVRAAYLVLLADGIIQATERKKLADIAAALEIPEIHFGAILEDLAVWLAAQHR